MSANAKENILLIVDDEPINRMLLRKVFSDDYRIEEAADGLEALTLLRKQPSTVAVVLDLQMPVLSGFEVLKTMRGDPALSRIPVVVVTASEDTDAQDKAFSLGAVDIITKPYSPQAVRHRINNIVTMMQAAHMAEDVKWRGELVRVSEYDAKTGLFNRATFSREAAKVMGAGSHDGWVLVRWDIDRFKVFNDTYGSQQGDVLLAEFGRRCQQGAAIAKGLKVIGHFEADHFVALWRKDEFDPASVYSYVSRQVNESFVNYRFMVRMGCYAVEPGVDDIGVMCDRALMALRSVKNDYEHGYAWYDESMRSEVIEEQQMVSEMNEALAQGQFVAYYQPQINYVNGQIIGAEALVRWNHPRRGLIPPGRFVPLFEKNGFVFELDRYIWGQAARQIARWHADGIAAVPISVNVSRRDVYDPHLLDIFTGLLADNGLKADQLNIEITESSYMENPEQLIQVVSALRAAGFKVEMDDFGSGYSSLNTLKDVPVDVLKMDMKFVAAGRDNTRSGSILSSIVRMANAIDLPVIAEGVETAQQADYLKSIDCFYMQGYYFSKPVTADAFTVLLTKNPKGEMMGQTPDRGVDGAADFLNAQTQSTLLFNSFVGGAGIIEYSNGQVEALRLNDRFFEAMGTDRLHFRQEDFGLSEIVPDDRDGFIKMIQDAIATGQEAGCETRLYPIGGTGSPRWMANRVRFLSRKVDRYILYLSVEDITARKALQQHNDQLSAQLSINNQLYQSVINEADNLMLVADRHDYRLLLINDATAKVSGIDKAQALGMRCYEYLFHRDSPCEGCLAAQLAGTSLSRLLEHEGRRYDNRFTAIEWNGHEAFIARLADRTEAYRRQAELQKIIANVPGGLAVFRLDGEDLRRTYLSEGAYQVLGYNDDDVPSEQLDQSMSRIMPQDAAAVRQAFAQAVADKTRLDVDFRVMPRLGGFRWVNLTANPVDVDGMLYFYGIYSDITSRREEVSDNSVILENVPGGVYRLFLGRRRFVDYVSDGYCRMTGYTRAELRRLILTDDLPLVIEQDRSAVQAAIERLATEPRTETFKYRYRTKDGATHYAQDTVNSSYGPDGIMRGFGQCIDVTMLHQAEEELHVRQEEYRIISALHTRRAAVYDIATHTMSLPDELAAPYHLASQLADAPRDMEAAGIIHAAGRQKLGMLLEAIQRGDGAGQAELAMTAVTGGVRQQRVSFTGIRGLAGQPAAAVIAFEDVTDEYEAIKSQSFERNSLFKALAVIYPIIIAVNVTKGRYYRVSGHADLGVQQEGDYDGLLAASALNLPNDQRDGFLAAFGRTPLLAALGSGTDRVSHEYQRQKADGQCHWIGTEVLRVYNPYDDDVLAVALSTVIDERKRSEEGVRQALASASGRLSSQRHLDELINLHANILIAVFYDGHDDDPYIIGSLPPAFGHDPRQLVMATTHEPDETIHPDDRTAVKDLFTTCRNDKPERIDVEFRVRDVQGGFSWLAIQGTRFTDDDGRKGYIGVYSDDRQRHDLFEQVRINEEETRLSMAQMGKMICRYDVASRTLTVPQAYADKYGLPTVRHGVPGPETKVGGQDDEQVEAYMETYRQILDGRPAGSSETMIKGKDGTVRWERAEFVNIFDGDGRPVRAIIALEDTTAAHRQLDENRQLRHDEQVMRLVAEHSARVVYYYDFTLRIIRALDKKKAEAAHLAPSYADPPEGIIGRGRIDPDSVAALRQLFSDLHLHPKDRPAADVRLHIHGRDGREQWFDLRSSVIADDAGQASGAVLSFLDITDQHTRELAYARYRQSVQESRDDRTLYFETDITADLVEQHGGRLGAGAASMIVSSHTQTVANLMKSYFAPESRPAATEFLSREHLLALYDDGQHELMRQWPLRYTDGSNHWVSVSIEMVADPYTDHVKALAVIRDITKQKQEQISIQRQAQVDGLTEIYNRATAEKLINAQLSAPDCSDCALLILDLDDLKGINDMLGHAQGDSALRAIAREMKKHFRSSDIIARVGGDEFIAFLPGMTNASTLRNSLTGLTKRLAVVPISADHGERTIRSSIGVTIGKGGDDFAKLYKQADLALYHVKRNGKNDYVFYTPAMSMPDYTFKPHQAMAAETGHDERQLIDALGIMYDMIVKINLTSDQAHVVSLGRMFNGTLAKEGTAEAFIADMVGHLPAADRPQVVPLLSRTALMTQFDRGRNAFTHDCRIAVVPDGYMPFRLVGLFYRDEHEDVCAYLLGRRLDAARSDGTAAG